MTFPVSFCGRPGAAGEHGAGEWEGVGLELDRKFVIPGLVDIHMHGKPDDVSGGIYGIVVPYHNCGGGSLREIANVFDLRRTISFMEQETSVGYFYRSVQCLPLIDTSGVIWGKGTSGEVCGWSGGLSRK